MTDSQHPISDERWSAYLDGQLSPEETAQLDERLATDAVARRAVEELRQLRESLRSLPRPTLGRAFTDRVMQQVRSVPGSTSDNALSSPPTVLATDATSKPSGGGAASDMTTSGDSTGWRRGIIWAALAVAASIVVLLRTPAPDRNATIGKLPPTADDSRGFSTAEQEAPPVPAPVGEPAPASDSPVLAAPRDQSSDHRFRSTDEFHSERERVNGRDRGADNSRYQMEAEPRGRRPAVSLGMETPATVAPDAAVPQPAAPVFSEPMPPARASSVSPTAPGAPAARGKSVLAESEEKSKKAADFRELAGEGDDQSNAQTSTDIERPIAGKATADGEGLDQPTNRWELDAKAGIAGATTAEEATAIAGANAGAEEVVLLEAEVSPDRLPALYGNLMNRYSWSDQTRQNLAIQTQAAPEHAAPEQAASESDAPEGIAADTAASVPSVPEEAAIAASEGGKAESVAEDARKEEPTVTDAPTGDVSGGGGGQQNLSEVPALSADDYVDELADNSLAKQTDERQAIELFYKQTTVAPEIAMQFGEQRGMTPNFRLQAASVEETVKEVQANQQPKLVWFFVDLPPEDVEQEVRQQGRVINNSVVTPVPLVVQQNVNQALVQNNASVANNYFHFQPTQPATSPPGDVVEDAAPADLPRRDDVSRKTESSDGDDSKQPSDSNAPRDSLVGRSVNNGPEADPAQAKDIQEEAADQVAGNAADKTPDKTASDSSAANNTLGETDARHDKSQAARELTEHSVEGRSNTADLLSQQNRSTGNTGNEETDADFALRQQNASPEAAQATTNRPAGTNGEEVLLQRSYANDQKWNSQNNSLQNNSMRNSSAQNNRYGTNRRVVLWLRVVPDPPPVASPSPVP